MDIRWVCGGFESDLDLKALEGSTPCEDGSEEGRKRQRRAEMALFPNSRGNAEPERDGGVPFSFPHGKNFSPTSETNDVVASF